VTRHFGALIPSTNTTVEIVQTMDDAVEVYREPRADGYAAVTLHGPGDIVAPLAFPDVGFAVSDLFA
jgi:hypothetical protein